jgi:DNA-binding transcriptional LysR family regulator
LPISDNIQVIVLTATRLRQAVALAEHGSFRRAARALQVSQPALTRGIQALEASLGVQLFDRQPTSVTPTACGELVVQRAKSMISTEADLRRDIAQLQGLETGEVNVALGPYPSVMSGYAAAARLMRAHPRLGVSLHVMNWRDVTASVNERRVDFGIAELSDAVLNEALSTEVIGRHRAYPFCRTDHPILGLKRLTLRDLLRFPWVHTRIPPRLAAAFPRPPGRAGRIDERTKDFLPAIEIDVPMQLAAFARNSDALIFGALSLVERELEAGTLAIVRTSAFETRGSYGFIHLKDRSLSAAARAFMQAVREEEALCVQREARLAKIYL